MRNIFHVGIILVIAFIFMSCSSKGDDSQNNLSAEKKHNYSQAAKTKTAKITFIELGSVNCIPCKKMQPVMKSVEEKYGDQIKVIFYDVWTQKDRKYARVYGIRLIPTQIFLDADGNEIARHEGYYPETEIDRFLQSNGLSIKESGSGNG